MGQAAGIQGGVMVFVSPQLGKQCVASGDAKQPRSSSATTFAQIPEGPRTFLMFRAIKLMQARGSAFARVAPNEVAVLVGAWLRAFAPSYAPPGISPQAIAEATKRRLQSALPRKVEPDLGLAALEGRGRGRAPARPGLLGSSVLAWANHTALLGISDLGAALEALGYAQGPPRWRPSARERSSPELDRKNPRSQKTSWHSA